MTRTTSIALAVLLLLPAVSAAQEGDAEARFHEAYVAEVVEGRIADAAKIYLELMEDESAPARIRAEAKFRFAVSAVLLGRADEARARLGELVRDPDTPGALRERAAEYARTVDGIGVGGELEKKLESLVFDLGRVSPSPPPGEPDVPDVYRDFEIIGPPAIPFLRKLLAHPDLDLRRHAIRILARMDAEGIVDAWTPEIALWGELARELGAWFADRPEELARFEERILALPDDVFVHTVTWMSAMPRLSEAFVREALRREGVRASSLVRRIDPPESYRPLVYELVRSEDPVLAKWALTAVLRPGSPTVFPPDDLLPVVVARVLDVGHFTHGVATTTSLIQKRQLERLAAWAARAPLGTARAAAKDALERSLEGGIPVGRDPIPTGVVDALLSHHLEADAAGIDVDAYAGVVDLWLRAREALLERAQSQKWSLNWIPDAAPEHVRRLLSLLPRDRRAAWVRERFTEGRLSNLDQWIRTVAPDPVFAETELWLKLHRTVPSRHRDTLLSVLPFFRGPSKPEPEVTRIVLRAAPELLAADVPGAARVRGAIPWLMAAVPEEERADLLDPVVRAVAGRGEQELAQLIGAWTGHEHVDRMGALLPAVADAVPAGMRPFVVGRALVFLGYGGLSQVELSDSTRAALVDLVRENLGEVPVEYASRLFNYPDEFPVIELLRRLPPAAGRHVPFTQRILSERLDDALLEMAKKRGDLTDLAWDLLGNAGRPVDGRVLGHLLPKVEGESLSRAIRIVAARTTPNGAPVSPETLEVLVRRLLEMKEGKAEDLILASRALAEVKPTELLFPVVTRLIGSESRSEILAGVDLATRLGREDSIPALVGLLDSMDPTIRDRARAAMDSIFELKRLKEEASDR